MRFFAVCVCASALTFSAAARAEIVVTISKSQQQLAVTVDGTERYRWPVSTGRNGLETPSGAFRPIRLERKWYSRKYDWSPMPYSIFFHRGYAVHGTYEKRRLGRAVSHGCVRLLPAHAATLFSLVRARGKDSARIVVTNARLPDSPGAVPMAAVDPVPVARPAAAQPEARRVPTPLRRVQPQIVPSQVVQPRIVQRRIVERQVVGRQSGNRFAASGDEATVMRGRAAWLRSLDRQYGIAR
ncbi:MAG: L,D-transpeptidase family protein [Pseudolabrys sp.]|nr:L,D-transpeptidase family protein [Pseudolabrys sp.]